MQAPGYGLLPSFILILLLRYSLGYPASRGPSIFLDKSGRGRDSSWFIQQERRAFAFRVSLDRLRLESRSERQNMKGLGKKVSFPFPFTHTPSPVLASLCPFLCHVTPALCDRERGARTGLSHPRLSHSRHSPKLARTHRNGCRTGCDPINRALSN